MRGKGQLRQAAVTQLPLMEQYSRYATRVLFCFIVSLWWWYIFFDVWAALFLNCNLRGSVDSQSRFQIPILNSQSTFTNIPKLQLTELSNYQPTVPSFLLWGTLNNSPTNPYLFCLLLLILLPSLITDTSWGNISVLDALIRLSLHWNFSISNTGKQ